MHAESRWGKIRKWMRRLAWGTGGLLALSGIIFLFWFRTALYHRWVRFPREETAWQSIRTQRRAPPIQDGWNEYRGILHNHSHFSHDSEVSFEEILQAYAKSRAWISSA